MGNSGERISGKGDEYYGGKGKSSRRSNNNRRNNYNDRQRVRRSRQRRTVQIGVYSCEYHKGETCCSEIGDSYDDKVCCKNDDSDSNDDARNNDNNRHTSRSKDGTTEINSAADGVSDSSNGDGDGNDSPAIFLDRVFSQVALKKTPQAMTGRNNNSNINMNMINNICTKETISDISSGDYL